MTEICSIDGCKKPVRVKSKRLCGMHHQRLLRTGDVHTVRPPGIAGEARKHFMYGAWAGMISRCHNKNHASYPSYGALGISVCPEWRTGDGAHTGFERFLADMGERPKGKTLDRIDPTGNYCKDNCRWATAKQQRANLSEDGKRRAREKGSKARRAYWGKITEEQAAEILRRSKTESQASLGREFGIARQSVGHIIRSGQKG